MGRFVDASCAPHSRAASPRRVNALLDPDRPTPLDLFLRFDPDRHQHVSLSSVSLCRRWIPIRLSERNRRSGKGGRVGVTERRFLVRSGWVTVVSWSRFGTLGSRWKGRTRLLVRGPLTLSSGPEERSGNEHVVRNTPARASREAGERRERKLRSFSLSHNFGLTCPQVSGLSEEAVRSPLFLTSRHARPAFSSPRASRFISRTSLLGRL